MLRTVAWLLLLLSLAGTFYAQDTKENADFKLAINLYNEGFYDLAISQLKKFIENYPNSSLAPDAQFYLGMSYFKIRRYDDARMVLQDFALTRPNHPKAIDAFWTSAECLVEMKNYREAGFAYEKIKVFYPKSKLATKALMESAKYFELAGDIQNLKKVLLALIQEYPGDEFFYPARFKYAETLLKENNLERALIEYKKIFNEVEEPELKTGAYLNIAKINILLGKIEEAGKILTQIISSKNVGSKIIAEAYIELGRVQGDFGEYEEGINYTRKALDFLKDSTAETKLLRQRALLQLANYYFNIADYQNSIKAYNELTSILSETDVSAEILLDIAQAFERLMNFKKATEFYLKVVDTDTSLKNRSEALYNLGMNYLRLGDFTKAIEAFKEFIELNPKDSRTPGALFRIGLIYEESLNDPRKAIFYYSEVINIYPKSKYVDEAIYHTALCYEKLGEIKQALENLYKIKNEFRCSELYDNAIEKINYIKRFVPEGKDIAPRVAELVGDLITGRPRYETALKLADFYSFYLKDFANALRYYDLAIKDAPTELVPKINYQKSLCVYNLFKLNMVNSDSAKGVILNSLGSVKDFSREKVDTLVFYLYEIETAGLNPSEKRKVAEDFLKNYPYSNFASLFIYDMIAGAFSLERWNDVVKLATDSIKKVDQSLFPDVLYKRAYANYKLGNKQKAIGDLNTILQNYSPSASDIKALLLLSNIYRELKNYADAIKLLRRVENDFFYTDIASDVKRKVAEIYFDAGDYLKAISEFQNYLSESLNPEVIYKIALSYHKLGDIQSAKKYYRLYLSTPRTSLGISTKAFLPYAGEAYYALANIYRSEGLTGKAVYYLDKASKFDREIGMKTILEASEILMGEEKYDEALKKFNEALALANSDSIRMYIQSRIIICHFRMNNIDNANKEINLFKQKFAKYDIKNYLAEFEVELGGYYLRNRDNAKAVSIFNGVIKNYPNTKFSDLASYWIAKTSELNGNIDEAIRMFLNLNAKPIDKEIKVKVNLALGNAYFKLEKYDSATIFYRYVIETTDDLKMLQSALNNLLACYEELGYYELAIGIARRYIERFPNADDIVDKKIKIGVMYEMLGNYDQALSYFQKLLEEADRDLEAELHYYIGEALFYKGEYEQAILEFLKVPYLVTRKTRIDWTANAFYMAGQAYERMKKYEQAINMYQQIIDRPGIDPLFKAGAQKEIERVRSILKQ